MSNVHYAPAAGNPYDVVEAMIDLRDPHTLAAIRYGASLTLDAVNGDIEIDSDLAEILDLPDELRFVDEEG